MLQSSKYRNIRVFPGCPVVKTLHFHCWGVLVPCVVRELRICMAKKQNKTKQEQTQTESRDFSVGPVAKTLCSQCRGSGFNAWSEN